jgi:cytochrome b involved in lipid metabolism
MTMEEFEAECKKGRKLTIINNSVVDCEKWINDHPGGKMVIEALISKDSTDSFTKIHGPSSHNKEGNNHANEMVKTLSIATLASR